MPLLSTRMSRFAGASCRSILYCSPEQPPPITATRNTPCGRPCFVSKELTFLAALGVTFTRRSSPTRNAGVAAACDAPPDIMLTTYLCMPGRSTHAHLLSHLLHTRDHVAQLLLRGPTRGLAQPAVRREGQPLGWRMLQARPHSRSNVVNRFDVVTLHINDPHRDILSRRDLCDDFQFRKFAARHFDVDLVHVEVQERRKHWRV